MQKKILMPDGKGKKGNDEIKGVSLRAHSLICDGIKWYVLQPNHKTYSYSGRDKNFIRIITITHVNIKVKNGTMYVSLVHALQIINGENGTMGSIHPFGQEKENGKDINIQGG